MIYEPIKVLKPGTLKMKDGAFLLDGEWRFDMRGREGQYVDHAGEILIALREYINTAIDARLMCLPMDKFDEQRANDALATQFELGVGVPELRQKKRPWWRRLFWK